MEDGQTTLVAESVAAVDLGSNSFHMIVAREDDTGLVVLDRMRERVALAGGLDSDGVLSSESQERALACLRRFGQRLWGVRRERVRAVGTHTLRVAANSRAFLREAEQALGHPIEVISGLEEARLTHLGVARALPTAQGRRLVIDIGGGSTECILGDGLNAVHADSLSMGSLVYTQRFFPDGKITPRAMRRAMVAAASELQAIEHHYHKFGWQSCIGSSGTMVAIEALLVGQGWSSDGITLQGMRSLRRHMVKAGEVSKLALAPLSADRAGILAGGVAIILSLFDRLGMECISASKSALREGVLHDLLGRIHHEDERDRTISALMSRYAVDAAQSRRVSATARSLLSDAAARWGMDKAESAQLLDWAASLHEVGLGVNYDGYQRHSAYLVQHSNMPGFSRSEQDLLSFMIDNHRKKFRLDALGILPGPRVPEAVKLSILLRLAVCLNRGRRDFPGGIKVKATVEHERVELKFPRGWLERHPLTSLDLEQEREQLGKSGIELVILPPPKTGSRRRG